MSLLYGADVKHSLNFRCSLGPVVRVCDICILYHTMKDMRLKRNKTQHNEIIQKHTLDVTS